MLISAIAICLLLISYSNYRVDRATKLNSESGEMPNVQGYENKKINKSSLKQYNWTRIRIQFCNFVSAGFIFIN